MTESVKEDKPMILKLNAWFDLNVNNLVYIFQNLSLRNIFNRPMKSILMLILYLEY